MRVRTHVLGLLVLLSVITYMDRVCISVSEKPICSEFGLTPDRWGWVLGLFSLSYGLFEIPSGAWGDRYGPRRVLTRIVVWWSTFTIFTGLVTNYPMLLAARFLFGAGEAGAYPNATASIRQWFPPQERARAQGFVWGASRVGGALTPLVVVPLMAAVGWRGSFMLFGAIGFIWAIVWWWWYHDRPADHPAATPQELAEIGDTASHGSHSHLPSWHLARSLRVWVIMAMYATYAWGATFYIYWLPKYLRESRGLSTGQMAVFAALPFAMGALGNLAGGFVSDRLTMDYGPQIGRRVLGATCLVVTSVLLLVTNYVQDPIVAAALLAVGFGVMDCMLPCSWAICLDIGRGSAGAVSGAMNMAGQLGGFVCNVLFGYLIVWTGGYQTPILVSVGMFFLSSLFFLWIDPALPLALAADVGALDDAT